MLEYFWDVHLHDLQVVTDVRLWLRDEIKDLQKHMRSLITSVVDRYISYLFQRVVYLC
jgi:hypothetical protein